MFVAAEIAAANASEMLPTLIASDEVDPPAPEDDSVTSGAAALSACFGVVGSAGFGLATGVSDFAFGTGGPFCLAGSGAFDAVDLLTELRDLKRGGLGGLLLGGDIDLLCF